MQPPWGFEGTEGVMCLLWLGLDSLQAGERLPHPWAPSRGCCNPGMELLPNSRYATHPLIPWRTSCSQLLLASPLFWCCCCCCSLKGQRGGAEGRLLREGGRMQMPPSPQQPKKSPFFHPGRPQNGHLLPLAAVTPVRKGSLTGHQQLHLAPGGPLDKSNLAP